VEEVAPGQYKALVKIKVGPIRTSFFVDIKTTEERAPEYAAYLTKGQEGGRASRLSAESSLSLEAIDDECTDVTYTSHIKLVGRLGKFADGVLKKIADSISDRFIAAMRAKLEPERATPDGGEHQETGGLVSRLNGPKENTEVSES
jgi:carbon monoxide dehydrogenase subunit G